MGIMGGGGSSISVPVNLKLEVLQSSLAKLQSQLDKLAPNSKRFKELQAIISEITREMDKVNLQTSKPFGDQAQFSQTEKSIDNIEESFRKVELVLNKIHFSDLKLDPSQQAELKKFSDEIERIKTQFNSFKEQKKLDLLGDVDFADFKKLLNSSDLNNTFDGLLKVIDKKRTEIIDKYENLQRDIETQNNKIAASARAQDVQTLGFADRNSNKVYDQYQEFFSLNKNGILSFKSGKQDAFYEYLKSQLQLTPTQIQQLRGLSANEIEKVLQEKDGILTNIINAGADATRKKAGLETKQNDLANDYQAAQDAGQALARVQDEVQDASIGAAEGINQVNERIVAYKEQVVEGARNTEQMALAQQEVSIATENFRRTLSSANSELLKQQQKMNTFNGIKNAIINFMGFNQILNITRNAIRNALNHIRELDQTMNAIAVVTNMTTADLWKQVDAYTAIAQKYGVTIQGAYEVSKIYYQAGYDTNEVLTLTNETLKLSKIAGLDYATTTDYMMTAMRGFKLEMEDASRVVDVYSNLASHTAVSQAELAEAMTRTASSMESVGASFEETSAMIATMVAVTRESANNIGSAMKSIASRYGELKKGQGELVDENGEIIDYNKVDTALKSVGITLKDTNGEFRNFTDVIIELASKWDTLNSVQQRYIATQFAGNRQQSRFLALVSNIDLLQENIENAENAEGVGDIQAATTLEGLEAKINQVNVALQEFYTTLGIESVWKDLLDRVKNVLNTLNEMPKIFGKIPAAALIVVMNIINLVKSALLKGVQSLATVWIQALNNAKKDTEASAQEQQKSGENWINNFITGIKSGASNMKNVITTIKKDATNAFNKEEFGKAQTTLDKAKQMETGFATGFKGGSLLAAAESQFANLGQYGAGKKGSSFKNDSQQLLAEYNSLISVCEQYGITVNKNATTLRELKTAYQELIPELKNKETALRQESIAAEDAAQKEALLAEQQKKMARQKFASNLQQIASGLSTLALLLNDGSRAGELFSGHMQMAAGAIYAFTAAWSTNPIGAVITGLTFLVTGFSTVIETTEEKIERLSGEAEELQQIATQAKSDQKALEKSIETYEKLQKTRYESAEAAEEYQTAVDELASKYPELINGIDELGNITINEANLETTLAKAREATAKATLDAANAEIKLLEEKIKAEKDEVNDAQTKSERNLQVGSFYATARNSGYNTTLYTPEENKNILRSALSAEGIDEKYINEKLIDTYQKYIEAQSANDKNHTAETYGDLVIAAKEFANLLPTLEEQESFSNLISDELIANTWEEVQTLKVLNDELRGQEKIAILSKVDSQFADNKVAQEVIQNKGLRAFIAQDIYNDIGDRSWEDYLSGDNILYTQPEKWIEFYNNLSSANKKLFDEMFSEADKYAAEDFIYAFRDLPNELQNAIKSYFQDSSDYYREQIQNLGYEFRPDQYQEITKQDWQFYSQIDKEADEMMESGLKNKTENYKKAMTRVFNSLTEPSLEGIDNETLKIIESTILENGIITKEGIQASIDFITSLNLGEAGKAIIKDLEEARDSIVENIALSVQTEIESIKTTAEDAIELLGKAKDNISSFEEMDKVIKSASNFDIDLDYSDFEDLGGGKYGLSAENYSKYYQAIIDKYSNITTEAVEKARTAAENFINKDEKTITPEFEKLLTGTAGELSESVTTMFRWFGLNISDFYDEEGIKRTDIDYSAVYTQLNDFVNKGYLVLQQLAEKIVDKAKKQVWSEGIYSDAINKSYSELTEAEKEEVKYFNESYNTLLSDIMSKGTEYVIEHFSDYKGLQNRNELLSAIKINGNNYQSIVKSFAKNSNLTAQEYNAYMVQAIEKDSNLALNDAAKDVDFYSKDLAFATMDTIQKIADAIGTSVENLFTGDADDEGKYQLINIDEWYSKIENQGNLLFDSIYSVINSLTKFFSDGLEGNLSRQDTQNFQTMVSRIPQLAGVELHFVNTSTGFKLATESAIELYSAMKQIDTLQDQITFNDLRKYLEDTNEHYKTAVSLNEHIADLREKIAKLDKNTQQDRINQYQQELDLALEINKARLVEDDKSWDFFNADLQEGFSNPISLWKSYAEAEKWAAEVNKKGYADWEQVLQILPMVNRAAGAASKGIVYFGQTLDGTDESLTKFYENIEASGAVQRIDGSVVLNLKAFGTSVVEGADAMGEDFDKGIKEMAKDQVKLLDAEIRMLEGFVELENLKLDAGEDGILSFDELTNEENNAKVVEGLTKFANNIGVDADLILAAYEKLKGTDEEGALNFIKVLQDQLADWQNFESADLILKALGLTDDQIKQIKQQIEERNKAIEEGTKPPDNITQWAEGTDVTGTVTPPEITGQTPSTEETQPVTTEVKVTYTADTPAGLQELINATTAISRIVNLTVNPQTGTVTDNTWITDIINGTSTIPVEQQITLLLSALTLAMANGANPDVTNLLPNQIKPETLTATAIITGLNLISNDATKILNSTIDLPNSTGEETTKLSVSQIVTALVSKMILNSKEADVSPILDIPGLPEGQQFTINDGIVAVLTKIKELSTDQITFENKDITFPDGTTVTVTNAVDALLSRLTAKQGAPEEGQQLLTGTITLNGEEISVAGLIYGVISAVTAREPADGIKINSDGTLTVANGQSINLNSDNLFGIISLLKVIWPDTGENINWDDITNQIYNAGTIQAEATVNLKVKNIKDQQKQIRDQLYMAETKDEANNLVEEYINNTLEYVKAGGILTDIDNQLFGHINTKNVDKDILDKVVPIIQEIKQLDKINSSDQSSQLSLLANSFAQLDAATLGEIATYMASIATNASAFASENYANIVESWSNVSNVISEVAQKLGALNGGVINTTVQVAVVASGSGAGSAKGNVALAKGTQTLMGELGPELYVTGGRYYVAGQSGAEFVNLPDDAIVFNHLQTKRLLGNNPAGRGKPIKSEGQSTALATGNITGPAKASASEALATLKRLRSMWASIANASAQDLANAGGGGGGGDDDKQLKNVTAEIQRWYNLLRQIDKLEKDISYQEQLRAKIESDRVVNGRAMYSTYKEELKYLDQEIARNKELANLQKSWYDHKREELANSAYGKIFTYDENGLQQYVGDSRPGSGLGLDILENLTQMRVTGEAVGAAKNVKTQLDYLQSVGFDIEALKFNKDGTTIDTKKLKGDKLDEAYVQMMQNFWDSVDGWRDELDGIYDSYHEQLENVISNEEKRNGLLQEIIDNQLSVEQSVYKAIEEREQAAIDRAQEERDALSDSAEKFLDGLSEQLDKERNMYDRNQSSEELNKLRRQLAILQRSGGSASQIRELQNQITSQEQDAYFQAQQDQIDAIKEASDAQLERLDHQIDIMTETLEYQKEHGLLWKEVYDVMAGTPEQIQQFIMENTPDFQSNSALQVTEDLRKLKGEIELWISSRDDSKNPIYTDAGHNWSSYVEASQNRYKDILTDELLAQAKAAFDAEYVRSSDPNAAGAAADAILNKKLEEYNRAHAPANATGNDTANTINNGKNGSGKYWNIRYPDGGQAGKRFGSKQEAEAWKKQMVGLYESIYKDNLSDSTADAETVKKAKADFEKWKNSTIFSYSHGGLADYTGLAMVHGSKTRPEAFFNAEQTAMWKNDILGKNNSLMSLLFDLYGALGDFADSSTYNTINRGESINIEKAEVVMNVGSIANDYDARRAGESALEEMLNIARKTGTRGVSRR